MVRIELKNTDKVIKALEKYGDDAISALEEATIDQATKIAEIAKLKAPVNNGTLQNSINWTKIDSLTYEVGTNQPYAPYIEFGTGAKVKVPDDFKELADRAKNKKDGSFKDGLEDIKLWCKRKGIDVKLAYIIFVNILNNGIDPKPFMYPAYLEGKKQFKDRLKKSLDKLNKKFNG